jgi:hypothetical protein
MARRKGERGHAMLDVSQEHSERCYSHSAFHSLTKQKSPDYGKTNLSMLQFRSDEHNTKSGGTQGLKTLVTLLKAFWLKIGYTDLMLCCA